MHKWSNHSGGCDKYFKKSLVALGCYVIDNSFYLDLFFYCCQKLAIGMGKVYKGKQNFNLKNVDDQNELDTKRKQRRTTGETEFRKAVITSPPSDTIWLNTCSRITFTWWMGWFEWRLDMDHQLILTANCEKYCTAYFIVEDLVLDHGQVFSTALMYFIYLFKIKLVDFILYYCRNVLEIMLWCVCVCWICTSYF